MLDDFQGDYFAVFYCCEQRDRHYLPQVSTCTHTLTHKCQLSFSQKCTNSACQLAGGKLSLKATSLFFGGGAPFLALLISSQFFLLSSLLFCSAASYCADTHLLALGFSLIPLTSNRFSTVLFSVSSGTPLLKDTCRETDK